MRPARYYLQWVLMVVWHHRIGQPVHRHAHAHNDYEHQRPLLDALQFRFNSVEVMSI